MKAPITLFWFRRDLRLTDNIGLYHALHSNHKVCPIFIFDPEILDQLPKNDARVSFIHAELQKMRQELQQKANSGIALYYGKPKKIFAMLLEAYSVAQVYTNADYEPYALDRDASVEALLQSKGIPFYTFKDQVIFEKNEVVKENGSPYVVYTPYKNRWKAQFRLAHNAKERTLSFSNFVKDGALPNLTLENIGFSPSPIKVQEARATPDLIANYEATRNFPAMGNGTSRLGPHLRFGTVSIRRMVHMALKSENHVFLNELIWREFFMQILWHFPHTVNRAFKPTYDRIPWRNNETEFERWKNGTTGYALVDAGMRQLNATGYMHNRVRMVVASFLCKHLLIDWRWGEAYFAEKLLDFELASNVGNWQWAAGSGVDAAPYFRIFNPMTQIKKFDKDLQYINTWVPDLQELTYPDKMVDHKSARERCLKAYKTALG